MVMPHSTLPLVDALESEARRLGLSVSNDGLRAQLAYVRALADELGRYHPAEARVAGLHDQLSGELTRLVGLVSEAGMRSRGDPRRIDVLVVDDDPEQLRATAAVVRDLGFPVRTASSGKSAFMEFEREPAAVILSDWSMPGMSGLDLCRTLKQLDPQVYAVLLTAHDEARDLDEARHSVDDFLVKPVDVADIETRLRAAAKLVEAIRAVALVAEHLRAGGERAQT
jgi:CheY-like chemotaxis protein